MENEKKVKMLAYILNNVHHHVKFPTAQMSISLYIFILSCVRKQVDSVCTLTPKGVVV